MTDPVEKYVTYTGPHKGLLLSVSGVKRRLVRDEAQQVPATISDAADDRDDCSVTAAAPAAAAPLRPGTVRDDAGDDEDDE